MVGLEPTMCLTTADYKSAALPFGSHQHSKNIVGSASRIRTEKQLILSESDMPIL